MEAATKRRRYPGRAKIKACKTQISRIDEDDIRNYAALLRIFETCLYNNGYSKLNYLPGVENRQLSALYDDFGNIRMSILTLQKKTPSTKTEILTCEDLYLVTALFDGSVLILDEDELLEACENGKISPSDYALSISGTERFEGKKCVERAIHKKLCQRLLLLFK